MRHLLYQFQERMSWSVGRIVAIQNSTLFIDYCNAGSRISMSADALSVSMKPSQSGRPSGDETLAPGGSTSSASFLPRQSLV